MKHTIEAAKPRSPSSQRPFRLRRSRHATAGLGGSASLIAAGLNLAWLLLLGETARAQQVVRVWSGGSHYVARVPADITNVAAFAPGGFHCLVLRNDGTAAGWGNDKDGQVRIPPDATNLLALAAGGDHSLALRRDGTVIGWGRNWDGQASPPPNATNVIAVTAGWAHSVALRGDGTAVAWGNNAYGQTAVPVLATELQAVAAGYYHTVALRTDGTVVTWGWDVPTPAEATNVAAVAAGWEHTLALRHDGTVVAWGDDSFGQCTVPAEATNVTSIAAGYYFSVARRADGKVLAWGRNSPWLQELRSAPANLSTIAAGEDYVVGLSEEGPPAFGPQPQVVSAAASGQALLAPSVRSARSTSFQWYRNGVAIPGATNRTLAISQASLAHAGTYVLEAQNAHGPSFSPPMILEVRPAAESISCAGGWGNNNHGQLFTPGTAQSPKAISAGAYHVLALNEDGRVVAWGKNSDGQTSVPPAATNVIRIAAGGDHSLALLADGTVVGWGRDWDGQATSPGDLTNAIQIAAGWAHSLALRADGTVVGWGNNQYSQADVPALPLPAVAIAAGYYHSLALLADGRLASWGVHDPPPESLTNVVAIAGGWAHSLAVLADGSVVAWGDNRYGQCDVPASATNIVAVSAGWWHSLALRADGTILAWGAPHCGVLQIPAGLRNVSGIAAGEEFSFALVRTGPPIVEAQPWNVVTHQGGRIVLVGQVSGTAPVAAQWLRDGQPIPAATNRALVLADATPADNGTYSLTLSNASGITSSSPVDVLVRPEPQVLPPVRQYVVAPGVSLCLDSVAFGAPPLAYRWQFGSTPLQDSERLSGATSARLCLAQARLQDSGTYYLCVSNTFGVITQAVAELTVSPIIAWGEFLQSELYVPPGVADVVSLAAGESHGLALDSNGLLTAWGDNTYHQCSVPTEIASAAAAGKNHSLALLVDGQVIAWGDNSQGQTNVPFMPYPSTAIAAGTYHNLALNIHGNVTAWGANASGQCNVPDTATNVVALAAGDTFSLALRADGTVVSWGNLPPKALSNVLALSACGPHAIALHADGSVSTWGTTANALDSPPPQATNAVAVAAGAKHFLALLRSGELLAWGENDSGQITVPPLGTNIARICAGHSCSLALVDAGQFSQPAPVRNFLGYRNSDVLLAGNTGPGACRWLRDGVLIPGQNNPFFIIEDAQTNQSGNYELVVTFPSGIEHRQVFSVAITPAPPHMIAPLPPSRTNVFGTDASISGHLAGEEPISYSWQLNGVPLVDGPGVSGAASRNLLLHGVDYADAGLYSLMAENPYGRAIVGATFLHVTPIVALGSALYPPVAPPISATNVISVGGGSGPSMALRADGTVAVWGSTSWGQDLVPSAATNMVEAWSTIWSGWGLRADGSCVFWSTRPHQQVPADLTNVIALAPGDYLSAAVRADGTVSAWGSDNSFGQLNVPAAATNAIAVAVSDGACLVLRRDGSLVSWGAAYAGGGQVPAAATNVAAIAAGSYHFLALRRDGSVIGWGSSQDPSKVPSGATNLVAISAAGSTSLALRADGTLFEWGPSPEIQVPSGISEFCAVAAGSPRSVALVNDRSPGLTFNQNLTVKRGASVILNGPKMGASITAYQWKRNGQNIVGATNSFYWIPRADLGHAGAYEVAVTNALRTLHGPATVLQVSDTPLLLTAERTTVNGAPALRLELLNFPDNTTAVVEASPDLQTWHPALTLQPPVSSEPILLPIAPDVTARFYRVRESY